MPTKQLMSISWGLLLPKKSGRQAKFSQPFISAIQIIFNNYSLFLKIILEEFTTTKIEFNFFPGDISSRISRYGLFNKSLLLTQPCMENILWKFTNKH